MGPKSIENHVLKIFGRGLSEIGAPLTPGVSLGTKILVSKFFLYHPPMMLFLCIFAVCFAKNAENNEFIAIFPVFCH